MSTEGANEHPQRLMTQAVALADILAESEEAGAAGGTGFLNPKDIAASSTWAHESRERTGFVSPEELAQAGCSAFIEPIIEAKKKAGTGLVPISVSQPAIILPSWTSSASAKFGLSLAVGALLGIALGWAVSRGAREQHHAEPYRGNLVMGGAEVVANAWTVRLADASVVPSPGGALVTLHLNLAYQDRAPRATDLAIPLQFNHASLAPRFWFQGDGSTARDWSLTYFLPNYSTNRSEEISLQLSSKEHGPLLLTIKIPKESTTNSQDV